MNQEKTPSSSPCLGGEKESSLNREDIGESEKSPYTGRFWSLVKGSAFGQRCLRQHIIGDYIVDYLFRKSKVIVEIDGGYHFTEEQQKEDALRTEWLEGQGYKVIRFTNERILCDTDNVIKEVKKTLSDSPC